MTINKQRTLLVGIDALCWEYLEEPLSKGLLPNIQKLIQSGCTGTLSSVMPPMTPVAWSSLVTGKMPAKHGIYEWVKRQPESYEFVPYTTFDRSGTPIWDRLNIADLRIGLVNIPFSYPPPSINGFVVCGFGAPTSATDLIFPPSLKIEMEEKYGHYQPEISNAETDQSPDEIYHAEKLLQEQKVQIAVSAANQHNVDILVINLMFLDHANHYFADMQRIEKALEETDTHLGYLISGFKPTNTLLISDHGSRRIDGRFLLGSWLRDHGFSSWANTETLDREYINWLYSLQMDKNDNGMPKLFYTLLRKLRVEAYTYFPSILSKSIWKSLDNKFPLQSHKYWLNPKLDLRSSLVYAGAIAGCIFLNLVGREPLGTLLPEAKEEVLESLINELSSIRDPDTREPLFAKIYRGTDIFGETAVGNPPDLILDHHASRWGLSMQVPPPVVKREGYFIRGSSNWYGEHSINGIYIFAGKDINYSEKKHSATILDIPPTLLYLCGVPIPDDYDGKVLTERLNPEFIITHDIQYQTGDMVYSQNNRELSELEENELLDQLRRLGYVE